MGDDLLRVHGVLLQVYRPGIGCKTPELQVSAGWAWLAQRDAWMRNCSWVSYLNLLPTPVSSLCLLQTPYRHHQLQSLLLCYSHSFDQFLGSALHTRSFCESLTPVNTTVAVANRRIQAQAQAQARTARIAHDSV